MEIYPKDSSAELDTDGVPQETTTELKTNILVKDGETIVIGGLFRDVITTTRSQVPLLGDLPLIGAAFRGTTDRTQREEVIIMLTPHIISEPSQVGGQERAEDISRKRAGAKDGLNPLSRKKMAEDHYAKAVRNRKEGDSLSAMKELRAALRLRPTYLEAIRLKERILAESNPDEVDNLERIMLEDVEQEVAPKWRR
jgi:Flp pilus assembly secretin CpaC